ncbi:MAG: glycerol-3-phosphate 1-O-acyltransferase PlsY [Dehalococcoidia bacterium]|nr:glycerol-3-phosphate 1-O-acyltransferase PlsY [Dehalococcoidia bacterium]
MPTVCLAGYLYGSIPFGVMLGRARGVDLLQFGSGRTGAANTLRTLGRGASVVAFLGDFSKGVLAVALARLLVGTPWAEALAGLCAVAGHNWSIYIRFRGGRGAVASAGAMAIMAPPIVVLAAIIFATVAAASRYISLASMLAAISAPVALAPLVYAGLLPAEYLAYGIAVAALIVLQHKDNIQRLRLGTERRIGDTAERLPEP